MFFLFSQAKAFRSDVGARLVQAPAAMRHGRVGCAPRPARGACPPLERRHSSMRARGMPPRPPLQPRMHAQHACAAPAQSAAPARGATRRTGPAPVRDRDSDQGPAPVLRAAPPRPPCAAGPHPTRALPRFKSEQALGRPARPQAPAGGAPARTSALWADARAAPGLGPARRPCAPSPIRVCAPARSTT